MRIPVTTLFVAFFVAAGLGLFFLKSQAAVPVTSGNETEINPDHVQIDYQKGVKVVATYLPGESTGTEARVLVEVTSEEADLTDYEYRGKIVWADTNIEPLPTLSEEEITQDRQKILVKMTFRRNAGSHYHFLVKDLAGVKNRVLHFYGL